MTAPGCPRVQRDSSGRWCVPSPPLPSERGGPWTPRVLRRLPVPPTAAREEAQRAAEKYWDSLPRDVRAAW